MLVAARGVRLSFGGRLAEQEHRENAPLVRSAENEINRGFCVETMVEVDSTEKIGVMMPKNKNKGQFLKTAPCASDGNRTRTGIAAHGILSPACLPIPPPKQSRCDVKDSVCKDNAISLKDKIVKKRILN